MGKRRYKKRKYNRSHHKNLPPILRGIALIVWCILCFAPLFLMFFLSDKIATSDPEVIASWARISSLWFMPLMLYWVCTLTILFLPALDKNSSRYMERPCYGVNAAKRRRKIGAILWSIGFVFVLLLSLLSLSGRECLTRDGKLQRYDMFNRLVDEYTADDVIGIQLRTVKNTGRYAYGYSYSIKLYTESDEFYFEIGSFFLDELSTLQELLTIRDRYEPNVTVNSTPQQLESVVRTRELSEEESALLYSLFNTQPPN